MRTIGISALACLMAGSALAQAQPFPKTLVDFVAQAPAAPGEVKAEIAAQDPAGPSCALVDWLLSPAAAAPAPVRTYATTLAPACRLPVADIDSAQGDRVLDSRRLAMMVSGDAVTLFARANGPGPATLCCSLQGPMRRLGASDVWALRYRLGKIDEALLTFSPGIGSRIDEQVVFRGPRAPVAPPTVARLSGRIAPDQLYSPALGETRRLTIYVPPGDPPPGGWPALFLADDGAGQAARMVEALVADGRMSPIAIVGTQSGPEGIVEDRSALGIPDIRSADYLPDIPGAQDRFQRHMTFLSRELVAYVRAKYGVAADPAKVAVSGYSNGGQLAFEAGLAHPEVFGAAIPRSAGWKPVTPDPDPAHPRARFYASAGLYEPGFLRSTSASVAALKGAGYQAEFTPYAAGHMSDQWDVALAAALVRIFPAARP